MNNSIAAYVVGILKSNMSEVLSGLSSFAVLNINFVSASDCLLENLTYVFGKCIDIDSVL